MAGSAEADVAGAMAGADGVGTSAGTGAADARPRAGLGVDTAGGAVVADEVLPVSGVVTGGVTAWSAVALCCGAGGNIATVFGA